MLLPISAFSKENPFLAHILWEQMHYYFCFSSLTTKDHNHYLQTLIWVKFSDCFFSWLVLLVVPFKEKLLQKSYLCIWCTWSSDEPSIITESTCIHTHLYTIEFWVEEHKGVWSRDIIKIPVILNTNKKATPWFQIWSICWQKKQ